MYFNVIRTIISNHARYIFRNGPMELYNGYDLPEFLDDCFITEIHGTKSGSEDILIFECC